MKWYLRDPGGKKIKSWKKKKKENLLVNAKCHTEYGEGTS